MTCEICLEDVDHVIEINGKQTCDECASPVEVELAQEDLDELFGDD